jgi:ferric-dicitrate binding protein FerR (iron transport regulator)
MESDKIKNIVQTFFGKDVSKKTLYLFGKWFRLNENAAEKDLAMEEIWENTSATITNETLDDLSKIKAKINPKKINPKHESKFSPVKVFFSYAAAIALIIISSVYVTYKIAIPAPLEYTQLSVYYGESRKITLADGTIAAVNAGSTLIYPKDFTGNTRTVFLTGEANFSVAKNPDKPFIVKTKYMDIKALGTKFCVQSYPNAIYTKATLIEGSIKVDMQSEKNKSYLLKPNDQLTYSHSSNEISINTVDANKTASWEDGYLIFQGATFDEIAQTLERKYNVVINYDGKKLNQQSYFVKFNPDETIDDAINILAILIGKSSYKKENSTIYFYTK